MNGIIDIHSHILPGVDDGAKTIEQTRRMLTIANDEGTRSIIATPHYAVGRKNCEVAYLEEVRQQVQEEASIVNKDLTIYLGNELFYSDDIIEDLENGKALTLAETRYVLVEFLPITSYRQIQTAIRNFTINGYIPIIAHAERYFCFLQEFKRIDQLIQSGAYIQININSLTGGILDKQTRLCKRMVKEDCVHFLGTDAHSDGHRAPLINKGMKIITRKYGKETAETLSIKNPTRLLEDTYI